MNYVFDDTIYSPHLTINLPDFFELIGLHRNNVSEDLLAYIAEILLKYNILDRPLITGDVSLLGRLALNTLIAKYNKKNMSDIGKGFKYHKEHKEKLTYLNQSAKNHNLMMKTEQKELANIINLRKISQTTTDVACLVGDSKDVEIYKSLNYYFDIYKDRYKQAISSGLMNIPMFVSGVDKTTAGGSSTALKRKSKRPRERDVKSTDSSTDDGDYVVPSPKKSNALVPVADTVAVPVAASTDNVVAVVEKPSSSAKRKSKRTLSITNNDNNNDSDIALPSSKKSNVSTEALVPVAVSPHSAIKTPKKKRNTKRILENDEISDENLPSSIKVNAIAPIDTTVATNPN